uniref:Uncharacterized protein n=1 Tax=Oryza brachyantha TaxID=4533 RepID=J3L8D7_ORYBR
MRAILVHVPFFLPPKFHITQRTVVLVKVSQWPLQVGEGKGEAPIQLLLGSLIVINHI